MTTLLIITALVGLAGYLGRRIIRSLSRLLEAFSAFLRPE